ncbi:hypothetical protein GCM10009720_16550 [Yaniella flava]|uniref:Helicase n=1 Tax=Yaniella flava TaxID=287930 RepID=A0ABP5FYA9_9MICC
MVEAQFIDDPLIPRVDVQFSFNARADNGKMLVDAVKALPSRTWNPQNKMWSITGTGTTKHPNDVLEGLGFFIDTELDDRWHPVAVPHGAGAYRVYPRFAGYQDVAADIGRGAAWSKAHQSFIVDATDLSDGKRLLVRGLITDVEDQIHDEAHHMLQHPFDDHDPDLIEDLAEVTSQGDQELLDEAAELFGHQRAGFGGETHQLRPFQQASAYAVATTRKLVCHDMGAGKTCIALAAVDLMDTQRLLVVCPPIVATNWVSEINQWLSPVFALTHPDQQPGQFKSAESGPWVRRVSTGRKLPDLPEVGSLVVPSSLLQREDVRELIAEFDPDAMIFDEAHEYATWESQRSIAARELARTLPVGQRLAVTGTPSDSHPGEMANPMAITGQLEARFGSYGNYMQRYTTVDHFGKHKPLKKNLPELADNLRELWVKKTKAELLPHLKGKDHDWRLFDVSTTEYRKAHVEVIDNIIEKVGGIDETAKMSPGDIEEFADTFGMGVMSPMFRAAGRSKIEPALGVIETLMRQDDSSPLIIFAHHQDVINELYDTLLDETDYEIDVLDGATSADQRGAIVEDFQDGQIDVLIASIKAAGVGVTLTRSHRIVFVEHWWTPGINAQAMDRADRIGQEKLVEVTHMVAVGTFDEQVHNVLARKIDYVDTIDPDADMGESQTMESSINDIITGVIEAAVAKAKREVKKVKK